MSGKLGFMLKRNEKLLRRCLCSNPGSPKTKRIWKKHEKYSEQALEYCQRTAEVAFMDGPDRAGK